ncbi:MAG: hypothetical protein JSS68_09240 [Actinobacteria bacterium]|nr:hypothetical protein [Actinomycetota bacterium]MBS1883523.1 hypothetical protein [Actinomycetota bacterium]
MSSSIEEVRLVALGTEAHRTICGLVQPTDEVEPGEVFASVEAWAEIRSAFQASEARPGEEMPAPATPGGETERILVLNDGEAFSELDGCRAFEVPAAWAVEEIEEALAGLANGEINTVRELEARGAGQAVSAAARCPSCGAEDHLRFEYRYDLLGLSRDGLPVLAEGGELTDIFCLACGEEVDDILGPEGPVLAGARGERSA